jgi:hypothetical protein
MIKEMVKGEKEKMLERNLYIHNTDAQQTHRKGTKYNIAAYVSHILNNGIILNMSTLHMPLFKIGVTFFEYAAWLYSA